MDRLVEEILTGRPVRVLPVRHVPTLVRGAYCWIDLATGMQPFVQDQASLLRQLREVVGASRLMARETEGTPPRSPLPVAGVPHLVLSDLGRAAAPEDLPPDPPERWAAWARWIGSELGSRVVALVPGAPERYPDDVQRAFCLLRWDRGTSVQSVVRALS